MTNFHPSDNDLIEFSAGNSDWAVSICVSAHLHYCPTCKDKVSNYNKLGGEVFNQTPGSDVSSCSFDSVMAKIKQTSSSESLAADAHEIPQRQKQSAPVVTRQIDQERIKKHGKQAETLPYVIQKLLPKEKPIKWSRLSPSLKAARLTTNQDKYEVSFHRIKRGGRVAEHDHRGREITLVLEGCFSDADGTYFPGDFLVREPGNIHKPIATQDHECLCLSVVEAPVKLTGFVGKLLNPFLSFKPA